VFAATKAAKVKDPLPYLLICAFIANAASFVLPISNPANLIIFRDHMPPLLQWLGRFALPSTCPFPADGTASLANGEIIGCLVPKPSKASFSSATQRANAAAIARYFADSGRESLQ
jgi:hypothetical protein